ncbi:hypothetical protein DsansV1_C16g0139491 [Dioscorea sansibarensis]
MVRTVKRERGNREEEAAAVEGEVRENRHGTTERRALRSRYLAVKNLISEFGLFCLQMHGMGLVARILISFGP